MTWYCSRQHDFLLGYQVISIKWVLLFDFSWNKGRQHGSSLFVQTVKKKKKSVQHKPSHCSTVTGVYQTYCGPVDIPRAISVGERWNNTKKPTLQHDYLARTAEKAAILQNKRKQERIKAIIPPPPPLTTPLKAAEQWITLIDQQVKVTKHNLKILVKQHVPINRHLHNMVALARRQGFKRAQSPSQRTHQEKPIVEQWNSRLIWDIVTEKIVWKHINNNWWSTTDSTFSVGTRRALQ